VVIKLTIVQVTKLQLLHEISKRDMICFAKPGLTQALYEYTNNSKERIFNNMQYVHYLHLTEAKPIHKRPNSPSRQRGCYMRTMTERVQLEKKTLGVSLTGLDVKTN
jgi:hypothetical protein